MPGQVVTRRTGGCLYEWLPGVAGLGWPGPPEVTSVAGDDLVRLAVDDHRPQEAQLAHAGGDLTDLLVRVSARVARERRQALRLPQLDAREIIGTIASASWTARCASGPESRPPGPGTALQTVASAPLRRRGACCAIASDRTESRGPLPRLKPAAGRAALLDTGNLCVRFPPGSRCSFASRARPRPVNRGSRFASDSGRWCSMVSDGA